MMDKNLNLEIESLIVKYLSGEASQNEKATVLAWAKESPENAKQLVKLRNSKELLETYKNSLFNSKTAYLKFQQKHISTRKIKTQSLYYTISAVAVVAFVFVVINMLQPKQKSELLILAQASSTIKQVELIDGSIVTLNAQSSILSHQQFNKNNRTLLLKGEAFFEIAHDTLHPFTVNIQDLSVQVLGTSFNIYNDTISNDVIVTIKTGKVKVNYKEQTLYVEAGRQITFNHELKKIQKSSHNVLNSYTWKTGNLTFKDTPLQEVIRTLNKEYHTSFEIASPEIASCRLTASFQKSDISSLNELLSILVKVEINEENGKQVIYRLSK